MIYRYQPNNPENDLVIHDSPSTTRMLEGTKFGYISVYSEAHEVTFYIDTDKYIVGSHNYLDRLMERIYRKDKMNKYIAKL